MPLTLLDFTKAIQSVATAVNFTLTPDMPLCVALDGFLREQATVLPVTVGRWRNTLLGEASRQDVLLATRDRLTYPQPFGAPRAAAALPS